MILNLYLKKVKKRLEVLGYSRKQTTKIVSKIKSDDPEISTELLIKRALNNL